MKSLLVLLFVAVVHSARYEKASTKIPGSFLIKIKDGVSLDGFVSQIEGSFSEGKVNFKWNALNTISVNLPEAFVKRLLTLDAIEYVEEDGVFYTQAVGSWGLDRIDQRSLPLDDTYSPAHDGAGQTIYIVDTGIRHSHTDYGGRASYHWDYESDNNGEDCNGHGTHVAGVSGSATYGVAQGVSLKSVRVLSCFGSGSTTNVVNGVNSINDGVGSMSVGGGASPTLDTAVANAVGRGVVMVVVAGNSNADACNYSPGRETSAITVASTDSSDNRASSSNYGTCVDLFAPGQSITSTWYSSDTAINTISGTSVACPHVSGAAALLLEHGISASNVATELVNEATTGVVGNPGSGSPNLLLFVDQHEK